MKTFEYRGFDLTGQSAQGLVEGIDSKDARERLTSRGILAERLHPATERQRRGALARSASFGLERRAGLYRELAALVQAGLPLAQALEVLIQAPEQDDDAVRLADVRDRIREGAGFSEAWSAAGAGITPFEKAVLRSGEKAGNLGDILDQLATYLEDQHQLRESVKTALLYPVFVLGLAIVVAVAMFGFILPNMRKLFEQTAAELPLITRILMGFGDIGAAWVLVALAAMASGVYAGLAAVRRHPARRERMDQRLFRLPVIGKGYRLLASVRFARTLGLLLRGGVGLVEGMELAGAATGSPWLASRLRADAGAVRDGASLAQVLRNIPPFGGTLPGWIHAGEASGNLVAMLEKAAARHEHQWKMLVRRLTAVIEPVLILCVALIVMVIALAVLLPILRMNEGM
jgi:type II secretory pathway component PulF